MISIPDLDSFFFSINTWFSLSWKKKEKGEEREESEKRPAFINQLVAY